MTSSEIHIQGGYQLSGEVAIQGSKNSFQKIIAGCIAVSGEYTIENVPDIQDAASLISQFESVGGTVIERGDTTVLNSKDISPTVIDPEITKKSRASILFAGAMLGRFGEVEIGLPGGDDFGVRPIDYSLEAFRQMGAVTHEQEDRVTVMAPFGLQPAIIRLPEPSLSATTNTLLAATGSQSYVKIDNCAHDPDIQDLLNFLSTTGHIVLSDPSRNCIEIMPGKLRRAALVNLTPDRSALATYAIAGALAGNGLTLTNADIPYTGILWRHLRDAGALIKLNTDEKTATISRGEYSINHLTAEGRLLPPHFMTDWGPQLQVLMTQLPKGGTFTERVQKNRFAHVPELVRMGADASLRKTRHNTYAAGANWSPDGVYDQCIYRGGNTLTGTNVTARDIRNGAALVLAGLVAEGQTTVRGVDHINRGYEDFVGSLQAIGARVT